MADNAIGTEISPKEITFQPGGAPVSFGVTVVNESDRFASFQLEVLAAGADAYRKANWYEISPEVSTKNPPGDATRFRVTLLDNPVPGFVGVMNLTVRVFSLELTDEDREVIRVNILQGNIPIPLQLSLPVQEFRAAPGDLVEIPVEVYNPCQLPTEAVVVLKGIKPAWLVQGRDRVLRIAPGQEEQTTFTCQLPETTQTICQVYPLEMIATHAQGPPAEITAKLEVIPQGKILFESAVQQLQIPAKWSWVPGWFAPPVRYPLALDNQSNLRQEIYVNTKPLDHAKLQYTIEPAKLALDPGQTGEMAIEIQARRPIIGRDRRIVFNADPKITDERLGDTTPASRPVHLKITPMIPLWLMIAAIPVFLYILWLFSWFNPNNPRFGHQAAVNSVDFDGKAENLVTGSSDQDIRGWRVEGFFWPWVRQDRGIWGETGKAVRTVQLRPVDNDQVAAGLENGDIQLWHLRHHRLLDQFYYRQDDRVLALQYEQNSRYLWTGHGSGVVHRWAIDEQLASQTAAPSESEFRQPARSRQFDFAVYSIAFVDREETILAVAGRFNQLVLWDTVRDRVIPVDYREGGKDDYIFSIASAAELPTLLATGDNQGWITLWDLEECLDRDTPCQIRDQWSSGHDERPVQSVSLSEAGCYLASGGEDGWVRLWPLLRDGGRASQFPEGIAVVQSSPEYTGPRFNRQRILPAIRAVQLREKDDKLLISSGSDDTQVRVNPQPRLPELGCDEWRDE